jgi:hypothetical protein
MPPLQRLPTPRSNRRVKIPISPPPSKLIINHHISRVPFLSPKFTKALPEILQLSGPDQAQCNNQYHKRKSGSPKDPLVDSHVAHVEGVHAEDGSDGAEGEEDDGYDCEGVDSCFLAVFVGVDFLDILFLISVEANL